MPRYFAASSIVKRLFMALRTGLSNHAFQLKLGESCDTPIPPDYARVTAGAGWRQSPQRGRASRMSSGSGLPRFPHTRTPPVQACPLRDARPSFILLPHPRCCARCRDRTAVKRSSALSHWRSDSRSPVRGALHYPLGEFIDDKPCIPG